jgi:RHS repeat-associated protein
LFSGDPARLVRFELPAGGWLQTGLAGARRVAPRVSGSTVSYPGILPGVTLEYAVSPAGLKERIVLASASADVAGLRFTVTAGGGLVPRAMPGGATGWYAGGVLVLVSPAPFMMDARVDRSSPAGHPWSPVAQRMWWDASSRVLTDALVPGRGWLSAGGRVWPVTVDPTITIAPVPCQSYNPDNPAGCAHNVMISSDAPTTNFNSSMSWPLPVGTTSTGVDRGLVQFPMGAIPSGSQIDSADLNLYWDDSFYPGTASTQPPQTVQAYQSLTAWNPATVTWNSNIQLGTEGVNQVVVTSTDAGTSAKGPWPSQPSTAAANGSSYRYDQDTTAGDTFTFVPQLTEPGTYRVDDHYVASTSAATAAPFTVHYQGGSASFNVNQQSGTGGVWTTLGSEPFAAGTAGSAVLGDGPASSTVRVEADGVRFTKFAQVTDASAPPGQGLEGDRWDSFAVRNIVQNWVSGAANDGFVLKAANEAAKGIGGPEYERSGFYYNGETATYPQLVVTYGQLTSVTFKPITVIRDNGADLSWTPYVNSTGNPGKNLAEYQVHRSVFQSFTPSASTLVAPVAAGTTSFNDTTAAPAPPGAQLGNAFYYMIAVKTQDGSIVPGPVQLVRLPLGGQTTVIIRANGAATLSSAQPTANLQSLFGFPWLMTGNNGGTCSTCFGVARSVFTFPSVASLIPAGVHILDSELKLWGVFNNPGGAPSAANYQAHNILGSFTAANATWNSAANNFDATATDTGVTNLTNDPNRQEFTVTSAVQSWLGTPSSQHGLMIKLQNESSTGPQDQEVWMSTGAAEPSLAPALLVTYTDPAQTYYAPATPHVSAAKSTYTTQVTVANPTGSAWGTNWQLGYHWVTPDGTTLVTTPTTPVYTALPAALNPGSQAALTETVATPDTVTGTAGTRSGYQLVWDMYNSTAQTWLSSGTSTPNLTGTGPAGTIPPAGQVTSVAETAETLGLEKYYQYTGVNTGSGSGLLNNDATGNTVWNYNPFSNPSRGFSTFVRLDYNSMDTSESSMGFGWSLQASTLTRLGTPLDFHPNPNPTTVTLTDGDGTSHWFTWNASTSQWLSPPGVHYYLQQVADCSPNGKDPASKAWLMTRPDRTQFWFDCQGYQTAVIDRNGNEADFTYAQRKSNNQPVKFLDYITDPAGRQTLTLSYYAKGDTYSYIDANGNVASGTNLTNPKIIDEVKSITDVSGRTITFLYTTQGLMAQMTDGDGTTAAKVFKFGYDMTQGNKNVKLVSVTDPRGNATQLAYYTAPQDPKFKWSLNTITDRRGGTTSFAYTEPAGGGIQTVVTDQNTHASTYLMDTTGRPVQVTNAKSQVTKLAWDADNNVTQLTEDNGAVTTWTSDPNTGYPLTMKDAEANKNGTAGTSYTYQTGLNGHVADLISKLTPQQRLWTFGYDAFGNLTSVTDPDGNASGATAGSYTTHYTYDPTGQLLTAKDADGNTTTYSSYDVTGYPQTITDALSHATSYAYDSRGNVTSVTDPLQDVTTRAYDVFGRPLQTVVSKDHNASPPVTITTPAPVYDGNDNITQATAPTGAVTNYAYDSNDELVTKLAPPDTSGTTHPQTTYGYDPAGNRTSVTEPDGNVSGAAAGSFTTTSSYDAINELTSVTDAAGDQAIYGYDDVGNKTSVKDPLGNLTQQAYNFNHWPTVATDAANHTTSKAYDLDGLVTSTTDQNNNATQYTLDPRGDVLQVMVPHDTSGATTTYNTTQYVYDQAGNRTQVLTPRALAAGTSRASSCVTTQTCPFTDVTQYDADNRVSAQQSAYDPADSTYNTPAVTSYAYDPAGRVSTVTAPPSGRPASGGPNVTQYGYFDNGWVKSSTDPWNITTSYDYNNLGQQATRTITSADGSMSRTMTWGYYPGGQLASLADDGVPTGLASEMVDNSDINNTTAAPTGSWTKSTTGTGYVGYNYQTDGTGTAGDTFTWKLHIPADGSYKVYVAYPAVSGAATSASYTVTYSNGTGGTATATVPVNQTQNTSTQGHTNWVALGTWAFTQAGTGQNVTLTQNSAGTVVADAVKVVRDTTGVTNTAHRQFAYTYDPNASLTGIADSSTPAPAIASYALTYNGIDQLTKVEEDNSAGTAVHTTTYGYDAAGNLASRGHDSATSSYAYDPRNLLATETDKTSASDPSPQVSTFTYTPDLLRKTEVKPNGNNVTYSYFADQLLQHQIETTPAGATVAEHTYAYTPDGVKSSDAQKLMNADTTTTYLTHTLTYSYDPRDRLSQVQTDGATTESYTHDATGNVTAQTINNTPPTTYNYDRDRLLTAAVTGGPTTSYNYDPLGRLDTVTSGASQLESNTYDGFDHIVTHTQGTDTTSYTYDPLNRLTSQQVNNGTATQFAYLGLSSELISEAGGPVPKSYTYTPAGERISQTSTTGGTTTTGYYTYNDHSDVEALTGSRASGGNTTATYGYTAYGQPVASQFTGADKSNANPSPTAQPFSSYRFNAMRWDSSSGQYDMGFRNYAPGLNQFLSRDMYNGALADMGLSTDPFTGNRYTFGAGNPISNIELDGHMPCIPGGPCGSLQALSQWSKSQAQQQQQVDGVPWARYNAEHDAAVGGAVTLIVNQFAAQNQLSPQQVAKMITTEMNIPGASKEKTGNAGFADIVLKYKGVSWVWEVKAQGQTEALAAAEASWYVQKLRAQRINAQPGFALTNQTTVPVPGYNGSVRVYSPSPGVNNGAILYERIPNKQQRQPQEQPQEQPQQNPCLAAFTVGAGCGGPFPFFPWFAPGTGGLFPEEGPIPVPVPIGATV